VMALVGIVAVACTADGSTDTSPSPSDSTDQPTGSAKPQIPTWPDGALRPNPDVAPKGVDLGPLRNPPAHRAPEDDGAPIDPKIGVDNINHLVFIVMENRSFDHYFGTYPGADGIPMSNGKPTVCAPDPVLHKCLPPYHDPYFVNDGGGHSHPKSVIDVNGGKMNGF